MKKLRVAFIGMAHIHLDNLSRDFNNHADEVDIIGVADVPPYTQEEREVRIQLNMPKTFDLKIWDDYHELLAQDIDIAVVCTDIKMHGDIVEEILGMNIHVVVDKPMAMDMEDAKRMYRAYRKSKAELVINWPIAWFPAFCKAKELADAGVIGKVMRVHYRSPANTGAYDIRKHDMGELAKLWWYRHECGGGSICDYAGYGCVLSTWIFNKSAKRVSGFKKNFMHAFADIEDYSTFTLDFGDGIGILEGSWSTMNNGQVPTGPIIYGTKGVIVADRYTEDVKVYHELTPHLPSIDPDEIYPTGPQTEDVVTNVLNHWNNGTPLHELITPEFNMKAMVAIDAGTRSCETGCIETAAEPFYDL